jgi:hypothetical protein
MYCGPLGFYTKQFVDGYIPEVKSMTLCHSENLNLICKQITTSYTVKINTHSFTVF